MKCIKVLNHRLYRITKLSELQLEPVLCFAHVMTKIAPVNGLPHNSLRALFGRLI